MHRSIYFIAFALLVLLGGAVIAWLGLGRALVEPPAGSPPAEEAVALPDPALVPEAGEGVVVEPAPVSQAAPGGDGPSPDEEEPEDVVADPPAAGPDAIVDQICERLLAFQDGDGGWRANDPAWGRRGTTSLVILFLLGRGTEIGKGEAGIALERGLEFLHTAGPEDAPLALAAESLALSEANALASSPEQQAQLRERARVRLRELMAAALPDGGWSAADPTSSDVLASGFAVMALKSAALSKLTDPTDEKTKAIFDGANAWFEARGASHASLPLGGTVESETLDASITSISKVFLGAERSDEQLAHAARVLAASPYDQTSPLQSYFTTLSLFQFGGEPWQEWSKRLRERLDATEPPTDPAEAALLGLSAEIYYRYTRVIVR